MSYAFQSAEFIGANKANPALGDQVVVRLVDATDPANPDVKEHTWTYTAGRTPAAWRNMIKAEVVAHLAALNAQQGRNRTDASGDFRPQG